MFIFIGFLFIFSHIPFTFPAGLWDFLHSLNQNNPNLVVHKSIKFSQERLNELYFFSSDDKKNIQGFRKIEAGPANKPYDRFCVAPGHQLGFNELKAIEISNFVKSINNEIPEPFNFNSGHRIQKLVDTIHRSSRQKNWLRV